MDFLDPKIERRNKLVLLIGYCFVAVAIAIATLVIVYESAGYGVDSKGQVTLSGQIFVSSQPTGARITFNDQPYKSNTNTKVVIPSGTYTLKINDAKYRTWQHQVVVNGGDVQHFDYPFLFPATLSTKPIVSLPAAPSIAAQSPDKRWVLLGESEAPGTFHEYDMKNPAKPVSTELALPAGAFTPGDGAQTWSMVEWASDNKHVVLLHTYQTAKTTAQEYILLDRDTPSDSINISSTLNLTASDTVGLYNGKTDQVYVYDAAGKVLNRITINDGTTQATLEHVLAFKSYGADQLLYVTDTPPTGKATENQVSVVLQTGQKTVTLRTLPTNATSYMLTMAQYDGDTYAVIGASNDSAAYIYKNPQNGDIASGNTYPTVWRRLPITTPNYVAFSNNTQFVLAENGQEIIVYDLKGKTQYHYRVTQPIDVPQLHASWMDGDRLTFVSKGKVLVFDYDYRNKQSLQAASASYSPFFSGDYSYLYSVKTGTDTDMKSALDATALTVNP